MALAVAMFVAIGTLTRVALLAMVRPGAHDWPAALAALVAGLAGDVVVALWLAAPFAAWATATPASRWPAPRQRRARRAALGLAMAGAMFVALAEVVFFDEFDGRFNFVAVDYLVYPSEVVANIGQSYPAGWMLAGIALATLAAMLALRPVVARTERDDATPVRRRIVALGAYAGVLVALSAALSPRLAHVSARRDLNEVAGNGYYTFVQALLGRDAPYVGLYATRPEADVMPRLRRIVAAPPGATMLPATAHHVRAHGPARRLNVVIVLEESLGSRLVGTLQPRDGASLTPEFDALAAGGTLLTHAYSTGNRTIRAIEATTASLPPLPGISVVRRPQSHGLFTLAGVLRERGYGTEFIYGGRALFDGMGDYMRNNGMERVVEQGDFPRGGFTTAWGVADEAIFDRALAEMDSLHATGRPFHVTILTVSNHRPYTYPAGRIPQDPAERRRANVVRYADWALGRFVRQARTHAFFDSTLFVLMGDHGARVYGASEIPLASYEVPILLYAPAVVPAARVGTLASSLDVPATVLGLLGAPYDSKFFGRDVLREPADSGRALMTHNAQLALMKHGRLAVLGPRRTTTVYAVDGAAHVRAVARPTDADRELVAEAIAYYQGADAEYRSGAYALEALPHPATATAPRRRGARPATARPRVRTVGR